MQPRIHKLSVPNALDQKGIHEIAFLDWGPEDAMTVTICVHGLTRNAHDFDLLATGLANTGRRVLALDMAGRGDSPWLADSSGYHYATYVSDCLAVMDNFHLRGVEWVGTSMGGIIGMLIAANHPSRIKKLVLNDIGSFLSAAALKRIYDYVSNVPTRFASREEGDRYLKEIFVQFGITDPLLWQQFVDHSLQPTADGGFRLAYDPAIAQPLRLASNNFTEIQDVSLADSWEQIDIPTLILRGELSDILDAETVSAMRKVNTKAESITIAGAGHAPSLMTPQQIQMVVGWLARPAGMVAGL
jgi:pimeloyl-ACP methyl ester carboxylesterase